MISAWFEPRGGRDQVGLVPEEHLMSQLLLAGGSGVRARHALPAGARKALPPGRVQVLPSHQRHHRVLSVYKPFMERGRAVLGVGKSRLRERAV